MSRHLLQSALRELDAVQFDDAAIPKRLHVTASSRALPADAQSNVDHIRTLNQGWSVTVYDDNDIESFLAQQFGPHVLAIYRLINPSYGAARADLFRYLCVFRLGGVYLDLKSTTPIPLDNWLCPDDRFILSQWVNAPQGKYADWGLHKEIHHVPGGEYQQWFVASSIGHPYLRAVCERVLSNISNHRPVPARFGRQGVLQITGPIAYTLAILPIRDRHPHRIINVEQNGVLHYSFYKGRTEHVEMNPAHYSVRQDPVVRLPSAQAFLFRSSRWLQLSWQKEGRPRWQRLIARLAKVKRQITG